MESFFDFYDLHNSTKNLKGKYIKNPEGKKCKFCQRQYPEVSFNTIPHIISELFGRNKLTSNFECDECNTKFQKYESDVSTMVQHYHALLNIKTKKGVPTFQSIKKAGENSTVIKSLNNQSHINFGTNTQDFCYDESKKTLTVNFRTRRFSPFSVYKIFMKMGISLLSEKELEINRHFIEFLNSEEPIKNGMQVWEASRYMLKTKSFPAPRINLYKAKSTLLGKLVFPEYCITINFINLVFQFFLPISEKNIREHDSKNELRVELMPAFVLEDINAIKYIDLYFLELSETEKITITDKIVMHYSDLIRNVK